LFAAASLILHPLIPDPALVSAGTAVEVVGHQVGAAARQVWERLIAVAVAVAIAIYVTVGVANIHSFLAARAG